MTAELRRDHRDARIKRFKWKAWQDITTLVGTALVVGLGVYIALQIGTMP